MDRRDAEMRSIKEQRKFITELNEEFSFLEAPYIELLDWAERARAWLAVQLDAGDYTPSQYEDLKKLLEELPE